MFNNIIEHINIEVYCRRANSFVSPTGNLFSNTMWLFKKDWGIDEHTEHESVSLGKDKYMFVYRKDGRLCLDTYHPAQRTIPRENYVNAIITVINNNFNK